VQSPPPLSGAAAEREAGLSEQQRARQLMHEVCHFYFAFEVNTT